MAWGNYYVANSKNPEDTGCIAGLQESHPNIPVPTLQPQPAKMALAILYYQLLTFPANRPISGQPVNVNLDAPAPAPYNVAFSSSSD